MRAAIADYTSGKVEQGASTITQQYVRAVYLNDSKTVQRKLNEAVLATRLERDLTKKLGSQHAAKEMILYRYLNTTYFGDGAYGAAAAAESYFHTDVAHLTIAQAAALAAIIPSPSRYGPREDLFGAETRRVHVLDEMKDQGMITQAQYDDGQARTSSGRPGSASRPGRPRRCTRSRRTGRRSTRTSSTTCVSISSRSTATPSTRAASRSRPRSCRACRPRPSRSSRSTPRTPPSTRSSTRRRRSTSRTRSTWPSCRSTRPPATSPTWPAAATTRPSRSTWPPAAHRACSPARRSSPSPSRPRSRRASSPPRPTTWGASTCRRGASPSAPAAPEPSTTAPTASRPAV